MCISEAFGALLEPFWWFYYNFLLTGSPKPEKNCLSRKPHNQNGAALQSSWSEQEVLASTLIRLGYNSLLHLNAEMDFTSLPGT